MRRYSLHPILTTLAVAATLTLTMACAPERSGPEEETAATETTVVAAEAPTADELANATYSGIEEEPVKLANGKWEGEPFEPGAASFPAIGLVQDFRLTGDLTGDGTEEVVVLLWMNSGGSGTYDYLAAMGRFQREVVNLGTAEMGHRVKVRKAEIVAGQVVLEVIQAGPEDASCCPGQKMKRTWALDADGLTELEAEDLGRLSIADLAGVEWVLTGLTWDEKAPAEPEVTLVFEGEGIGGKSGCNRYNAGVTAGEMPGDLTISLIASTRMACPDEIMTIESRYLEALGGVTGYSFLAGNLVLNCQLEDDYFSMFFTPRELTQ